MRAPCGQRASTSRHTASAASSQRRSEPPVSATASVERCHVSWWSTSATVAPSFVRSAAFSELSSARLALSEPATGKCRCTRSRTTNASPTETHPSGERALDLPRLVDLELVAFLDVLVVAEHDAALVAGGDFAHVLVEPPQRGDLPAPHDRA